MTETTLDLNTLPVKIDYVGEILSGEWHHDLWRVTISKDRTSYHSFDYKTGLGLRKAKRSLPSFPATPKPVKPSAADVLQSLLSDADCAQSNFVDFCADLGYDDDSITALNVYKACCDTAVALRKYFSREQLDAIREQTKDL